MNKVKRINKILLLILPLIMLLMLSFCAGQSIVNADDSGNIKNTNIVYNKVEKIIDVSNKKVCDITERISVTFKKANINLGLSRNVSRTNKVTRIVDGKEYSVRTISKLSLNYVTMDGSPEYNFLEKEGDYYYINTGADGDYKKGQHVYEINYTYDLGEDFIKQFDDFTFDLMDYGFKGSVEEFSGKVKLPSDIDINNLHFRQTLDSTISNESLGLKIDGDTLSISRNNLRAREGITMQLILPQNYFDTVYTIPVYYIILCIIALVAVIAMIVLLIYYHLTAKSKTVQTVEFYPPKGCSPIAAAKALRGKTRGKDFAALIIKWADDGFITIKPDGKKDLILVKKKEMAFYGRRNKKTDKTPSGYNKREEDYFNAIFIKNTYSTKTDYDRSDTELRKATSALAECSLSESPYIKKNFLLLFLHIGLCLIPTICYITWIAIMQDFYIMFFAAIFIAVGTGIWHFKQLPIVIRVIFYFAFCYIPLIGFSAGLYCPAYDCFFLFQFAIAINIIGNIILARFVGLRTDKNCKLLGLLYGFKNFLLTAEIAKLEMLVEEDPEYFYNILPYCYVFNITKKIEERFKCISGELAPSWFNGEFSFDEFGSALSHSSRSFAHSFSSSSSGGGGSGGGGGGGSSGGGGGGGGCGGR